MNKNQKMKEKTTIYKLFVDKNKLTKKAIKPINQIFSLKKNDKSKNKKDKSLKNKTHTDKFEPIKVRLTPFNKRHNSKLKKNSIPELNSINEKNNSFNKSLYLSPVHALKTEKNNINKFIKRNYTESRNNIKEIKLNNRNCTTPYRRMLNNQCGEEFTSSTSVIIKNFNYNNVYNFNLDNERIKNKKIHFSNKNINKNDDITYNETYSNTCTSNFTYNKPKTSSGMATSCISTKNKNSDTFFKTFITDTNYLTNNINYNSRIDDNFDLNVPKLNLLQNKNKSKLINNNNIQSNSNKAIIINYNTASNKLNKYSKKSIDISGVNNMNNTYNSRLKNNSFSNLNLKAKNFSKFYNTSTLSLKYNKNNKKSFTKNDNEVNEFNLDDDTDIGFNLHDLFIFEDRINDIVSAFSNKNNIYDIEASNECNEFMNFYSKSTLKGIFATFFKEHNQLIIESSINLSLFLILIIHHMSVNNILFNEIISSINNILELLKINFALYIKQIQIFYNSDIIKKNYSYFHPFNVFLNKKDFKEIENEDDITYKIYQNCRTITNETKIIINYYQKINMSYYNYFIKIFNNISIQNENNLINIFFNGFKNENSSFNLITVNKSPYNMKFEFLNNNPIQKYNKKTSDASTNEKSISNISNAKNILDNIYIKTPKKIIKRYSGLKKNQKKIRIEIPYIKEPSNKKYTLVLNLNKTLAFYNKGNVILRPGLISFLSLIKPYYELISFSSEIDIITKSIIKEIESKEKIFDYNFGREHCVLCDNILVKDISLIGRDLSNTIIVDDNENSFKLNEENGIKISKFEGYQGNNKNDNALFELEKILILIYKGNYNDIRLALKDFEYEIKNKLNIN